MEKVIIFGCEKTAELALYYLNTDTEYKVVAFTVHSKYNNKDNFMGLPIIDFENLEKEYPPSEFKLFAPDSGGDMNRSREKVYLEGKDKGYSYISYISSKATICDNEIGENCFILEDNTIQPFTKIGNNVVLWSGYRTSRYYKRSRFFYISCGHVWKLYC